MTVGERLSQAAELVQLLDFVVDFSPILWYNVLVKLEQESRMDPAVIKALEMVELAARRATITSWNRESERALLSFANEIAKILKDTSPLVSLKID